MASSGVSRQSHLFPRSHSRTRAAPTPAAGRALPRLQARKTVPAPAPGEALPPLYRPYASAPGGWSAWQLPWPSNQALPREARASWFESTTYQQELDKLTLSVALSGNCSRVLIDGAVSFAQKEQALCDADVIFLKMYQFDNDDAGRRIAGLLERRALGGARVIVQYGIKSFYTPWTLARIKLGLKDPVPPMLGGLARLEREQEASQNPRVVLVPNDRPRSWLKLLLERDHEKYLITWRAGEAVKLIMGGMNISDAWMHGGEVGACTANGIQYRDTDVEIVGPTAKKAINAFVCDMGMCDPHKLDPIMDALEEINSTEQNILYPPSGENAIVRFVRNKPHHGDRGQYIAKLYESLLARVPSGEDVRIANAYLLPRRSLRRALVAAANRGVRVHLLINAPQSVEREAAILASAARALFRTLIKHCRCPENFFFYEFVGSPRSGHNAMHQKVASFGTHGPYIIGSSNLDEQSLHFNKEVVALIYDARGRRHFDAMWERDAHNTGRDASGQPIVTTRRLTAEALQAEPLSCRIKQAFLYRLRRIL